MSWIKAFNLLFFVLNAALLAVGGFFVFSRGYVAGAGFSQYEVITLVLACVAVLLTALGLFVAIIAIWGYGTLKQAAMDQAQSAAHVTAGRVAEAVAARTAEEFVSRRFNASEGGDYGAAAAIEEEQEPNADIQAPRG